MSDGPAPQPASAASAASIVERVWALHSFGRADNALGAARRGLAEHPDDADLEGSLAWLEFFHGDRERAEQSAERALALRPDDWRGLNILVEVAVARGEHENGEAFARRAVAAYPQLSDARLALAYALAQPRPEDGKRRAARTARMARHREVRGLVADAVGFDPERVETLRRGSILLAIAGDETGSAELLSRALALDPDNEELLMLVAGSDGTSEIAGLRLLSGVLSSNPQQRVAARALSDTVWNRTQWLATIPVIGAAALLLFGYLVFEAGLETTTRQRTQLGGAVVTAGFAWVMLFVFVRQALPKRALRRLFAEVWWVWPGIIGSGLATIAVVLLSLAFAIRGLPTQVEMAGEYIGGLTMMIGFVAWLALMAELAIVCARFASERRNSLTPDDAEGCSAARERLRERVLPSAIRVGLAALFALVPVVASGIATRPEAAGGYPAVALAIAAPPLASLALAAAAALRAGGRGPAARAVTGGVLAFVLVAAAACWLLADRHAGEFDPPPTPHELEMRRLSEQTSKQQAEFEESMRAIRELNERLEEQNGKFEEQGAGAPGASTQGVGR